MYTVLFSLLYYGIRFNVFDSMYWLFTLNYILAVAGLILLGVTAVLFFDYLANDSKWYRKCIEKYIWLLLLVTTIGSVALSLVYSEYFGFVPCSLCWLQRVALYPQALLAIVAAQTNERAHFALYGLALSVAGFAVAVYHYVYQMIPAAVRTDGVLPCLVDGSADCATKIIDLFGFVTFPFLSAVTFLFLIVLYLNLRAAAK